MSPTESRPGVTSLREDLARFRYSLFRLETLQGYSGSSEDVALAEWRRTGVLPVTEALRQWCDRIRDRTAGGSVAQRVHVVAEPVTEYMRFELASYQPNVRAGEDVRVIAVRNDWPRDVPRRDFWLIDSHRLWIMQYSADGEWVGAEQATDPDEIVKANAARDAALAQAMPVSRYVPEESL